MNGSFYAVVRGRVPGVYKTWPECEKQVKGFANARYKKCKSEAEALTFIARFKDSNGKCQIKSSVSVFPCSNTATVSALSSRKRSAPQDADTACCSKKLKSAAGGVINVMAEKWITEGVPVVYTDGSCMSNGMRRCKAGFGVFWGDNHPDNLSEPLNHGPPTNNRAELFAVIRALQQAEKKGYKRLVVRTDSNLLIQSMNVWIHSWHRNNWKTSAGTDVKNKDLLVELDLLLKKVHVCFDHVRGHVGIYGNEKADELARSGAERYVGH